MNGTDFIKAVDEGKVLKSSDGALIYKNSDERYVARTEEFSIYISGDELLNDEKNKLILLKNESKVRMVIDTKEFKVEEVEE